MGGGAFLVTVLMGLAILAVPLVLCAGCLDLVSGGFGIVRPTRNQPIDFRGRVVDELGRPIAGVRVVATIEGDSTVGAQYPVERQAQTDAAGDFSVAGEGRALWIRIGDHAGRRWVRSNPLADAKGEDRQHQFDFDLNSYVRYLPDPASPAIFVMVSGGQTWSAAKMSRGGRDALRAELTSGRKVIRHNNPFWPDATEPPGVTYQPPATGPSR